jgi:hypothetical protein
MVYIGLAVLAELASTRPTAKAISRARHPAAVAATATIILGCVAIVRSEIDRLIFLITFLSPLSSVGLLD